MEVVHGTATLPLHFGFSGNGDVPQSFRSSFNGHTVPWIIFLPVGNLGSMLNTDGSSTQSNIIAAGGLIRDTLGQWLIGFTKSLG